jgi:cytochrome b pre-mRNA-processing protein 3
MLNRLFRRKASDPVARRLYEAIVAQARRPEFYRDWGVPDSLDGRFDMIALHGFLVLHRLKRDHEATAALAQNLFDTLFLDMDRALRELGAGDLGVGKRVKAMARGFYGRVAAYEDGLSAGQEALGKALGHGGLHGAPGRHLAPARHRGPPRRSSGLRRAARKRGRFADRPGGRPRGRTGGRPGSPPGGRSGPDSR